MQYEILSKISKTEKSEVYLGSAKGYNQPVIIKKIKNADRTLYERVQRIDNPHIPKIFEMEEQGDSLIILEEYADGKEIDFYVKEAIEESKNGGSEIENSKIEGNITGEIVRFLTEVCDALAALHAEEPPIIHRDVKPSNILVGETGHVFLVDFDASRLYKETEDKDTRTLGTREYAPPEQYGFKQTDVRSDIYSFGAVMNELLDFEGDKLHPELRRIIDSCMAFDPDRRFSSILEVKKALENYKSASGKRAVKTACAVAAGIAVLVLAGVGIHRMNVNRAASVSGTAVTAEPTATPYDGEVTDHLLDYIDSETGESKVIIMYYALKEPEKTPVHALYPFHLGKDLVKRIKIQKDGRLNTTEIGQEYWNQDSDGVVTIDPAYLDTLDENGTYVISLDCDSVVVSFKLRIINYCTDASEFSWVTLMPGYSEFLKSEPEDLKLAIDNRLGRKLIKIVNSDTEEEIDESMYDLDTESDILTLKKELFEKEEDGTYLNYGLYFEELEGVKNKKAQITVCVRNRSYIKPIMEPKDFLVNSSEPEDIVIQMTWNDGKDKLESIYPSENAEETLSEDVYEVTEDSIIIKKEALKKIETGMHEYVLEFGDVGLAFTITVK